jgi:hypothetical protein
MIRINVKADNAELARLKKSAIPTAIRNSLSDTAQFAARDTKRDLPKYIHRPVPYTIRSVLYQKATYQHLESAVYLGDEASKYLAAVIKGGRRGLKRSEKLLRARGILPPGKQLSVFPRYRDSFGNISKGIIQKVLSNLQAYRHLGVVEQNSPRMKRKGAKWIRAAEFFVRPGVGIAVRRNGKLDMVLGFTDPMTYPKKLPFHQIVEGHVRKHFLPAFRRQIDYLVTRKGLGR